MLGTWDEDCHPRFTIRHKLQQVSTFKVTSLHACVCVCVYVKHQLSPICRWTGDRSLSPPHLALQVCLHGFLYMCTHQGCVHIPDSIPVYLFFKAVYACLCVSLALCMPVRLWIASGCEEGQS